MKNHQCETSVPVTSRNDQGARSPLPVLNPRYETLNLGIWLHTIANTSPLQRRHAKNPEFRHEVAKGDHRKSVVTSDDERWR